MRSLVALVAFLALVAGCAGGSNDDPTGRTWQLTELDGAAPLEGTIIDLTIDGEQLSGSAGCNRYSGTAQVDTDASTMTLGPNLASTMMACEEPIMEQEQRYLDALVRVTAYEMASDTLTLLDAEGVALVSFE
jgi:heat shock protein HslJ